MSTKKARTKAVRRAEKRKELDRRMVEKYEKERGFPFLKLPGRCSTCKSRKTCSRRKGGYELGCMGHIEKNSGIIMDRYGNRL